MQDHLIRLYNGPSDNLLSVHDRVAIQGRVLPKPVSYFPAAPKEDVARHGSTVCQQISACRSILAAEVLPVQLVLTEKSRREVGLHAPEPGEG
jgi:hypothetical protein